MLENKVREKTNLQKAHEAEALLKVEKVRADGRMKAGVKIDIDPVAKPPQGSEKGKSRDIVAEQIGFKSGREVGRAVKVMSK